MGIKIEITGDTAQEVVQNVMILNNTLLQGVAPRQPVAPKPEASKEDPMPKSDDVGIQELQRSREPQPKRGGKKAAPEAEVKKEDAKPEASDAPALPIEEVRAALMRLASEKGEDAVWDLLESFKAKSASTVEEKDRAVLVAKVEEMCG